LYPNPFNPETNLSLDLPAAGEVTFEVYDALGQRLRRIELPARSAGHHVLSWDGRDDDALAVASGVYLFVVRWDSPTSPVLKIRKGVLLR
ncbi:MAG TPA: hypothetical protein DIC52_18115, partial [Candidatus Latescibacteria bacterium]|nr:hypothetical protein [Candidatus Latescibacterota bacterium]